MIKNDITITEQKENYFLKENTKLKILFSYDYFEGFIKRNGLEEIFDKKLYLEGFDFEIVKLSKLNLNLDLESPDYISSLRCNKENYISEWLLYLWNDKYRNYWFFFFPDYTKNWEIKNDFLKIKHTELIDLTNYATFKWLFWRDWVVIALKI